MTVVSAGPVPALPMRAGCRAVSVMRAAACAGAAAPGCRASAASGPSPCHVALAEQGAPWRAGEPRQARAGGPDAQPAARPQEPQEPQEPHGARAAPPRAGARAAGWAAVINPILQQTVPACIQYGVNLMQLRALHDRRAGAAAQGPTQGPAQGPAAPRAQQPGAGGAPVEPGAAGGPVDPATLAAQLQRAAGEYNEVLQRGRSAMAALEATVTPGQGRRCRPRVCVARPASTGARAAPGARAAAHAPPGAGAHRCGSLTVLQAPWRMARHARALCAQPCRLLLRVVLQLCLRMRAGALPAVSCHLFFRPSEGRAPR